MQYVYVLHNWFALCEMLQRFMTWMNLGKSAYVLNDFH